MENSISAAAILPSNSAAIIILLNYLVGLEKELQKWSRVELPAIMRQNLLSSTSLSLYSVFTGVVNKMFFLKPLGG